jgi:anti-sigma factor RsiW
MPCVSPPELDDRQLLTYLDGEADHQVASHLEQCPHCRERAHRLARLQNRLTAQLYRVTCPLPVKLGEYHLKMMSREQAAAVAQHLAQCPHCRRELAQLKDYLGELASDVEFNALERVRVLVARLVHRGWEGGRPPPPALAPAYLGVRGEEEGIYVYQTDDVEVVIDVQDDTEQQDLKVLLGLVTGMDTRGLRAHLWQADQLVTTASVDDLGNFVIPHLAPASYELILSSPEVEIHLQTLEI